MNNSIDDENRNENENEYDFLIYDKDWSMIFLKSLGFVMGIVFIVLVGIFGISSLGFFIAYLIIGLIIAGISGYLLYEEWEKNELHKKLRDSFEREDLEELMDLAEIDFLEYKAVHAISNLSTDESREKLLEILFKFDDCDIRDAALTELEQIDDPIVISTIEEFLDSKDAKDDELFFDIALAHVNLSPGGKGEEILKQMDADEELDEEQTNNFLITLGLNSIDSKSKQFAEGFSSHMSMLEIISSEKDLKSASSQEAINHMKSSVKALQIENNSLQEEIKHLLQFQIEPLSNEDQIKRLNLLLQNTDNPDDIAKLTQSISNLKEPPKPLKKKFFETEMGNFILATIGGAITLAITLAFQKLFGII